MTVEHKKSHILVALSEAFQEDMITLALFQALKCLQTRTLSHRVTEPNQKGRILRRQLKRAKYRETYGRTAHISMQFSLSNPLEGKRIA